MVSESQPPHKIVNSLLTITNLSNKHGFVGELTFENHLINVLYEVSSPPLVKRRLAEGQDHADIVQEPERFNIVRRSTCIKTKILSAGQPPRASAGVM